MIEIQEYMKKSRSERRAHLILTSECIQIGGGSKEFKGLLAYFLGTTIPVNTRMIQLCHACNIKGCSNPTHLYWGTPSDNVQDQIEAGVSPQKCERNKALRCLEREDIAKGLLFKIELYNDPAFKERQRQNLIAANTAR